MRRSPMYSPSASLIHEVRMIAQHFFAAKTTQSVFARSKPTSSTLCVPCLRERKRKVEAVAVVNGNSVCLEHVN